MTSLRVLLHKCTYLELQQFSNSSQIFWSARRQRSLFALFRMQPKAARLLPVPIKSADKRLDWTPPDSTESIP